MSQGEQDAIPRGHTPQKGCKKALRESVKDEEPVYWSVALCGHACLS